jgi:hypothetical protein
VVEESKRELYKLEFTLRDFAPQKPIVVEFRHPLHYRVDIDATASEEPQEAPEGGTLCFRNRRTVRDDCDVF